MYTVNLTLRHMHVQSAQQLAFWLYLADVAVH